MKNNVSGQEAWESMKSNLQEKLKVFYGNLGDETKNVIQTFDDRMRAAKGQDDLMDRLKACKKAVERNYKIAETLRAACEKHLAGGDKVVQENFAKLKAVPTSNVTAGYQKGAEMFVASQMITGITPMAIDALSICALLTALLRHKEGIAYEVGALKELKGAVFDPGKGFFTLFTRLKAVVTRVLREDQTAGELFKSLREFEELMDQWPAVLGHMGAGNTFEESVTKAFAKWK